jgi:hypothetical protein
MSTTSPLTETSLPDASPACPSCCSPSWANTGNVAKAVAAASERRIFSFFIVSVVRLDSCVHTILTEPCRKPLSKNPREPPTTCLGWPQMHAFCNRKSTRNRLAISRQAAKSIFARQIRPAPGGMNLRACAYGNEFIRQSFARSAQTVVESFQTSSCISVESALMRC